MTPDLWRDIQTIPPGLARSESIHVRWQHVFLLASTAAAQIIRDRLPELKFNVVLRTSVGAEKSKEHFKQLCLTRECTDEEGETFALGYCTSK